MEEETGSPGVALVTGAGRRIGRAIALELAARGWAVGVHHHRSAEGAEEVIDLIEAIGGTGVALEADLTDVAGLAPLVARCADALGPVVCLVNNASLYLFDEVTSLEPAQWEAQMAVNLRAPVFLAQAFARQLPEGAAGNIINVIDQRVLKPTPRYFSYALAKSGLHAATHMLAQALAPRIRVNAIGPGPVLQSIHQSAEQFARQCRSMPLGRGSTPEEIAAAVLFILSAPSMTGQMLALDGGQHIAWQTPDTADSEP